MTEPLLRVKDLVKYFSVRGGLLSRGSTASMPSIM